MMRWFTIGALICYKVLRCRVDINKNRVDELKLGTDSTLEIDSETLQTVLVDDVSASNGLFCTTNIEAISDCNYVVTVPTPVGKIIRPDLTPLYKSSETGKY
jgi:UDP-N-acetyl-D-galactosamine dehydrogenase